MLTHLHTIYDTESQRMSIIHSLLSSGHSPILLSFLVMHMHLTTPITSSVYWQYFCLWCAAFGISYSKLLVILSTDHSHLLYWSFPCFFLPHPVSPVAIPLPHRPRLHAMHCINNIKNIQKHTVQWVPTSKFCIMPNNISCFQFLWLF